jgi:hypothetical protein
VPQCGVYKILDFTFIKKDNTKINYYFCLNKTCRKKLKEKNIIFYNRDFYTCNHCDTGHIALQLDNCLFSKNNIVSSILNKFSSDIIQNVY